MTFPRLTVQVSETPIDPAVLLSSVGEGLPQAGAVASFTGQVRDSDGTLQSLSLEHYPGMTEAELKRIAREAVDRFELFSAMIVHRAGHMSPGEPIVFVGAASAHRHAALQAVDFMMDLLKTEAPFWKKETAAGKSRWIDARESDHDASKRWTKSS